MKKNQIVAVVILGVLVLITLVYFVTEESGESTQGQVSSGAAVSDNGRLVRPNPDAYIASEDLKRAVFSGKLEEVNTGCFADGECYAVIDGKHVTAILGWTSGKVGSILGVEGNGFGDLEKHIGETVQVYAHEKADGTYTLYGAEEFYIKVSKAQTDV